MKKLLGAADVLFNSTAYIVFFSALVFLSDTRTLNKTLKFTLIE
jgi:hypothetical protein